MQTQREDRPSVSTTLLASICADIIADGGWWPFDRFMQAALYTPGLGYYAGGRRIFGASAASGSDFTTAPEMSAFFGRSVAVQVQQLLEAVDGHTLWEFGAGSGALAEQLLAALGERVQRYTIIDVSGSLQARQAERLARFGDRVRWASVLPDTFEAGVIVGNEVLDAMPVKRLAFDGSVWSERGVSVDVHDSLIEADRPTTLRPPCADGFEAGAVTEIHPQAQAFVATLAERMRASAALFIDYGFPEAEYYHPQRVGGTLMCHQGHRSDTNALIDVGAKDITSHLDFSALALAAQDAGAQILGYTSQGRFLLECGMIGMLKDADLRERNAAHRLMAEHEMGELFKVLLFARGIDDIDAVGFAHGDRSHRL
jgi:SAM-dependent MidA family methyltransferase